MAVLTAAVVLLSVLVLFNLLLTLALARRLRQVEAPGHATHAAPSFPDLDEVKPGTPVNEFTAVTTDGRTVTNEERYGDRTVYAFFDTGCSTCFKQLQPLVDLVEREGFTTDQVIAFVTDESGSPEKYTSVIDGHLTVVVHRPDELRRPFEPGGFPAFVLADRSGLAVRSGVEVSDLDTVLAPA